MVRIMTIEDYEEVYSLWLHTKGMGLNTIDDSKGFFLNFGYRQQKL